MLNIVELCTFLAVYSKRPVGHGLSSWTLEEVYMETCHVLSGLSRKCGMHLLSAAPTPVESNSTIEKSGKAYHVTSSEGNKVESVHEKGASTYMSKNESQPTARNLESDSSSCLTLPSVVCTSMIDESACESFHDNFGNEVSSNVLTTEVKEQGSTTGQCETPTTSSVGGNEDKVVLSSGCNTLTCIEASADEAFHDKSPSCDGKIIAASSLPTGINHNDKPLVENVPIIEGHDLGDVTSHDISSSALNSLSSTNTPRKDSGSSKEKDGNFMTDHKKHRLVEEPNDATLLENSPSTFRLSATVHKNAWSKEEEADNALCHNGIESMICKDACIAISPTSGTSQDGEGKSITEEKGEVELIDNENVLRTNSEGVMGCDKLSSAVISVGVGVNLEEVSKDAEGTMYRAEDGPRLENLMSITSSDATSVSMSMAEGSSMESVVDENATTIPSPCSEKCGADDHTIQEKRKKKKKNKNKKNKKNNRSKSSVTVSDTSSRTLPNGVQMKISYRSWLQNFTDYCKESHDVEHTEVKTDGCNLKYSLNMEDVCDYATNAGENAGGEGSCGRKRSLSTEEVCDVAQSSTKRTKSESDSDCKGRSEDERSIGTKWDKSDDLPLMANVDEVLVYHYILDLSVEFNEKSMKGNIVLFLEPRNEEVTKKQFQMTLDSTLVNIESVSEVVLPDDFQVTFCRHKQSGLLSHETTSSEVPLGFLGNILGDKSHTPLPFKGLSYSVYGWCVQISKPEATGKAWPRCVWIKYHTSPEGSSLTWATDQDGK